MATKIQTILDIVRRKILEIPALITPTPPVVAAQGVIGATTYGYKIVARNAVGTSIASGETQITDGNAVLSGVNYNAITWAQVAGATSYDVYRVTGGGTQGKIANTANLTLNDTGLAGDSSTAPTTNTSGITNQFWDDQHLLDILNRGIRDLQRAINDNYQDYFLTIDETNVSQAANATSLTGVPADVGIVRGIEARTLSDYPHLHYFPKGYMEPEFQSARAATAQDPQGGGNVYYHVRGAGGPVGAPTIDVAPKLSTTVLLRLVYIPTFTAEKVASDDNPIPGDSDWALAAWTVAYVLADEREEHEPDPSWIQVYATEKANILTAITPRQTDEPDVAEAMFEEYWSW